MSGHVADLLALAAAGALDAVESEGVAAHLRDCEACAARARAWGQVAEALRRLPSPRPDSGLLARTREAAEALVAERSELAFSRAVLGFLVGLGWTLTLVGWVVADLVGGGLALQLAQPLGSAVAWYGAYLLAGWVAAGASAVLLGRRVQEEGRTA